MVEWFVCVTVCVSAEGELVPYAEVINSQLVQLLNWSSNVGDIEPGRQRPMRYWPTYSYSVDVWVRDHHCNGQASLMKLISLVVGVMACGLLLNLYLWNHVFTVLMLVNGLIDEGLGWESVTCLIYASPSVSSCINTELNINRNKTEHRFVDACWDRNELSIDLTDWCFKQSVK